MEGSIPLRAGAVLLAGATFVGAAKFTLEHPKNPDAPLQPPAADDVTLRATPTPGPSGALASGAIASGAPGKTAQPRASQRPVGTPPPKITLQPGVHATELPGITFTHVS